MITVHDVARQAGVSIATVSRALNDRARISAATRARVLDVAMSLGYQPNDLARSLTGMATRTIALLLPDITNPFFPELVKGVQDLADERGHLLLLCHTAGDAAKASRDLALLRRKQVDGILLAAESLNGGGVAEAIGGVPAAVLGPRIPGLVSDQVVVDDRAGARRAVEHLLELGHRRIAQLAGPAGVPSARERGLGWADALRAAGITPDRRLVVRGDFTEAGGYDAGRELVARRTPFTAVFAANDLGAIGLLHSLAAAGLHVPDEVSVIGFDGVRLSEYSAPPLTTIAQPIYQLGRTAAELLLDRLAAAEPTPPQTVELETTLITRASTAPPPT